MKKMKLFLPVVMAGLLIGCTADKKSPPEQQKPAPAAVNKDGTTALQIDSEQSVVKWLGKKFTGSHEGTVKVKSGSVELHAANKTITKAVIEIDMNSLVCTDIEKPKSNSNLIKHLKNDDFFSVDKFPTATFELTKPSVQKEGMYPMTGNLTMKGQAHPIEFNLEIAPQGDKFTATGKILVDRTVWGIRYKSKKIFPDIGDKFIYDDFELALKLVTQ